MTRDWDEVKLSICIQHTPARDGDEVYEALREELPDADVITDPDPDGHPSTWRTYAECLRRTPRWATHRLILQDDVCICPSFLYAVKTAIRARPDTLLSFFHSSQPQGSAVAHLQAADRGETWSELDVRTWLPAQALAWPHYLIGPALRYAERHPTPGVAYIADDNVIAQFCNARGIIPLQSCPSLVEHVHHSSTSIPGDVTRPGAERAALLHVGEYHPVHDVDWTTGAW